MCSSDWARSWGSIADMANSDPHYLRSSIEGHFNMAAARFPDRSPSLMLTRPGCCTVAPGGGFPGSQGESPQQNGLPGRAGSRRKALPSTWILGSWVERSAGPAQGSEGRVASGVLLAECEKRIWSPSSLNPVDFGDVNAFCFI